MLPEVNFTFPTLIKNCVKSSMNLFKNKISCASSQSLECIIIVVDATTLDGDALHKELLEYYKVACVFQVNKLS